jgi:hypothetical protein
MEELWAWIAKMVDENGMAAAVGFLVGIFGPSVLGPLKALATKTPTKADDLLVASLEACFKRREDEITTCTAAGLNKILTDAQIVELVKLRKADIAARKALSQPAPPG